MAVRRRNPWLADKRTELVAAVRRGNSLVVSRETKKERSRAEHEWQKDIERLAQANGWFVFHIYNPQWSKAGLPDLILIRERVIWVELKAESTTTRVMGKLAPAQEMWRDMLKEAGQEWYCWHDTWPEDSAEAERVLAR